MTSRRWPARRASPSGVDTSSATCGDRNRASSVRCRSTVASSRGVVVPQPLVGEGRLDARLEQRRLDRAGKVVHRAHLDAADDAVEVVEPGHDDHRDRGEARIGLHRRERLEPVQLGHDQVEQHEIDRRPRRERRRAPRGRRSPRSSRGRAARAGGPASSGSSGCRRRRGRGRRRHAARARASVAASASPADAERIADGRGHGRQPRTRAASSAVATRPNSAEASSIFGPASAASPARARSSSVPCDRREGRRPDAQAVALEGVRVAPERLEVAGRERRRMPADLLRRVPRGRCRRCHRRTRCRRRPSPAARRARSGRASLGTARRRGGGRGIARRAAPPRAPRAGSAC